MDFFGRGSGRSQEQALSNPIRIRIFELFTKDEVRSLTATALATDLTASDGGLANVSVGQVAYHLACLRDAELIPAGKPEGHQFS
jgi:DNA-binding transcriptional ArsR family regulator